MKEDLKSATDVENLKEKLGGMFDNLPDDASAVDFYDQGDVAPEGAFLKGETYFMLVY